MPITVLKEIFGFDSFRPGQERSYGPSSTARHFSRHADRGREEPLLPGAGPMGEGLTVIVSPLISLMKDQVDSLVQSSVEGAATLHSGLDAEERWEVEKKIRTSEIRLLYVALNACALEFLCPAFAEQVWVSFVVDEAHCISEWGRLPPRLHSSCPASCKDLGSLPVLALTATATPRVRQDSAFP